MLVKLSKLLKFNDYNFTTSFQKVILNLAQKEYIKI